MQKEGHLAAVVRLIAAAGIAASLWSSGSVPVSRPALAKTSASASTRFRPSVRPVGDIFGLGTYIAQRYPAMVAPALYRVGLTGADWIREEFTADHLHSASDLPYSFGPYDRVIPREVGNGLHILGLLDYNNTWSKHGHVWMDPAHIQRYADDYARYAYAVAYHYRYDIFYWQVWNEPNIVQRWQPHPNPRDYAYLLKKAYAAIKLANPDAKVVIAGPSGSSPHAARFIHRVVHNSGPFDILAMQPYSYLPTMETHRQVHLLHQLHKPIWFSEIGWPGQSHCRPCGDPYVQANHLAAIYLIAAISSVQHVFWYDFRDDGTGNTYSDHFGLVEYDFGGKPTYRTYVLGRKYLTNSLLLSVDHVSSGLSIYRFRQGSFVFYIVWNSTDQGRMLSTPWFWGPVRIRKPFGPFAGRSADHHLSIWMQPGAVDYLVPHGLHVGFTRSSSIAVPPGHTG